MVVLSFCLPVYRPSQVGIKKSKTALSTTEVTASKKRGRPAKATGKRQPGRPLGEAGIMREYRLRMLQSPQSRKVIQAVFDAALTDGHPHQAAAWKLIMDRVAPTSGFDAQAGSQGRTSVQVIISGVPGVAINGSPVNEEELVDAEFSEVEPETSGG